MNPNVKKKFVFDLDSTLAFCYFIDRNENREAYLEIKNDSRFESIRQYVFEYKLVDCFDSDKKGVGRIHNVVVFLRPYIRELSEYLKNRFSVDIWSAGEMRYVYMLNSVIFPENEGHQTEQIYTKQNTIIEEKTVIKNLESQGYNLSNCLIVDDRKDVVENNRNNGIQIPAFNLNVKNKDKLYKKYQNDNALLQLIEWIKNENLETCDDVRMVDKSEIFSV